MSSRKDIDHLFQLSLVGDYQQDYLPQDAVFQLQDLGSREVFEQAAEWVQGQDPQRRQRGIDILAQFGRTTENPHGTFADEIVATLLNLLESETSTTILCAALTALGHLQSPGTVPVVAGFCSHPEARVRRTVAWTLGNFPSDAAVLQTLFAMMSDQDQTVCEWVGASLERFPNWCNPEPRLPS